MKNDRHRNQLLNLELSPDDILKLEEDLLQRHEDSFIFILLILKIVRSKLLVRKLNKPLKVSLVFAVYKEHNRIRSKNEHPHEEKDKIKEIVDRFSEDRAFSEDEINQRITDICNVIAAEIGL